MGGAGAGWLIDCTGCSLVAIWAMAASKSALVITMNGLVVISMVEKRLVGTSTSLQKEDLPKHRIAKLGIKMTARKHSYLLTFCITVSSIKIHDIQGLFNCCSTKVQSSSIDMKNPHQFLLMGTNSFHGTLPHSFLNTPQLRLHRSDICQEFARSVTIVISRLADQSHVS